MQHLCAPWGSAWLLGWLLRPYDDKIHIKVLNIYIGVIYRGIYRPCIQIWYIYNIYNTCAKWWQNTYINVIYIYWGNI